MLHLATAAAAAAVWHVEEGCAACHKRPEHQVPTPLLHSLWLLTAVVTAAAAVTAVVTATVSAAALPMARPLPCHCRCHCQCHCHCCCHCRCCCRCRCHCSVMCGSANAGCRHHSHTCHTPRPRGPRLCRKRQGLFYRTQTDHCTFECSWCSVLQESLAPSGWFGFGQLL